MNEVGCRIDIDVQCIYIGIPGQEHSWGAANASAECNGMRGYVAMVDRVLQLQTVDQICGQT